MSFSPDDVTILGSSKISPAKNYDKMRFAYDDFIEGGALRDGGAPRVFSKDYIGLVAQYAAVGLIDGVLPNIVYPFLQNYLNLPGTQTTTASTLVQLAWSFKVFYGVLSDCFPIYGYRRRPYMIIGWSITLATLIMMWLTPVGDPYFTDPQYRNTLPSAYTAAIIETINYDAANQGSKYIVPMMLCAFGYLLADVCADGIVVELAQREPMVVRGTTQSIIYVTRTIFYCLAAVIVGFGFNGEEYGGTFSFSLSFQTLMLILAICIVPMLPITWYFIREEQMPRISFRKYMGQLWDTMQTRAVYQVLAQNFFFGIFSQFTFVSKLQLQTYWAEVTPLNEKIAGLLSNGLFALAIWFTGKYGLHWDWRFVPTVCMIAFITLDAVGKLLVIWNVYRSQWFWLLWPVLEQLPLGVMFIVSTFIIIELSTEGHESAMYGLITTVSNVSNPVAVALTRNIDSIFDLSTERIQNDSTGVRRDVTVTVLIMYVVNLLSLFWLLILPRQKEETQALKRLGGSSRLMGMITVIYLSLALAYSVTTNIMSIFPSTACLRIVGGTGC